MERKLPSELVKRRVITLRGAKTDSKFGCFPEKRPITELLTSGIVILNKPKGPTSHQVAHMLKKILKISKAGHSGTLDPAVTGVLPTAFGRATRITQALLPAGKEYIALMRLHSDVPGDQLRSSLTEFIGKIEQLPPVRSAVKRQVRTRSVYYADILEINGRDVLIRFGCQGGTYVRKWIHDVGQHIGCGANMAMLVRTKAGPFQYHQMYTLQDVEDALWYYRHENNEKFLRKILRPVEDAVALLPKVWVLDSTIAGLVHGHDLALPGISAYEDNFRADDLLAVMSLKNELVCLGPALADAKQWQKTKRGYAVKTHKVFMDEDVYPSTRRTKPL